MALMSEVDYIGFFLILKKKFLVTMEKDDIFESNQTLKTKQMLVSE